MSTSEINLRTGERILHRVQANHRRSLGEGGSSGEYSRAVLDEKHPYRTFADDARCKGGEAEAERGLGRVIEPTRSQKPTLFPSAQIGDCGPTIFS